MLHADVARGAVGVRASGSRSGRGSLCLESRFPQCCELERRVDMIGGELGELGDDLVCRQSTGKVFEHVVNSDPGVDEAWLPTPDARVGVDERVEIHFESVPGLLADVSGPSN